MSAAKRTLRVMKGLGCGVLAIGCGAGTVFLATATVALAMSVVGIPLALITGTGTVGCGLASAVSAAACIEYMGKAFSHHHHSKQQSMGWAALTEVVKTNPMKTLNNLSKNKEQVAHKDEEEPVNSSPQLFAPVVPDQKAISNPEISLENNATPSITAGTAAA